MNDTERVIGMLQEFRTWAKEEFTELKQDSKDVKSDIRELFQFRWQLIGMSSVVSVIVAALATFLGQWLRHP